MQILMVLVAIAVVALLIALKLFPLQSVEKNVYESRKTLFTPAERSFLGVLEQALDSRYQVFAKVRLGDLVKPAKGLTAGMRKAALNRINQKHVDFVICTANEHALVGVVELDDLSHDRKDRSDRDAFVDQVLAMAGIPLLRVPAGRTYAVQELRARLGEMMRSDKKTAFAASGQEPTAPPVFARGDAEMEEA
jgi:very-short-patch-repair endonuclease